MSKNILITRKIPEVAVSILKDKGYVVDVGIKDEVLSQEELINLLNHKSYDGVITLLTDKIDKKIFENFPTIKIFANYASGFDNIDIVEAKNYGVVITNAPVQSTADAVAEHTLAFIIALSNRIIEADRYMREGKYEGWMPMNFIGTSIPGKTLGLVGVGKIGEKVAFLCKNLGMNIIFTDINRNEEFEQKYEAKYYSSLEELLALSDFVSLHVPLLDSTKHLINEKTLSKMKKTAFLINTSRGPVVDENALTKALQDKMIAGAGLDVFEFEPKVTPELLSLSNVILTPHIASASIEAREDMAKKTAQNIIDFFEGRTPIDVVNK